VQRRLLADVFANVKWDFVDFVGKMIVEAQDSSAMGIR